MRNVIALLLACTWLHCGSVASANEGGSCPDSSEKVDRLILVILPESLCQHLPHGFLLCPDGSARDLRGHFFSKYEFGTLLLETEKNQPVLRVLEFTCDTKSPLLTCYNAAVAIREAAKLVRQDNYNAERRINAVVLIRIH
jgi:hypothetical protein